MPNEIPVVFHNRTNYNYHFIMRESLKVSLNILEKIQESTKLVSRKVPTEKYIKNLIKMVMRVLQMFLTKWNLLIVQDLWQVHYQILLIIMQKEFVKLNVKTAIVFLNMKNLIKYKRLSCNKKNSNKIDEKGWARIHLGFLITILINLFCFQEKVFNLMNTWMNLKSLIKYYCLEKKIVTGT